MKRQKTNFTCFNVQANDTLQWANLFTKLLARIKDLEAVGLPFTNYGVFLSYMEGKEALQKVLEPWNIN